MAAMTTSSVFVVHVVNSTSSNSNGPSGSPTPLGLCTIAIGVIGIIANILELNHKYKNKKKTGVDLLSLNQNLLDAFACLLLSLSYTLKQTQIVLSGHLGDWLCTLFYSDTILWIGLTGSIANQVIFAFLLCLQAKHFSLYKKLFRRKWLIYFFVALAWIDGAAVNNPFELESYVKDEICYTTCLWTTTAGHVAFGAWAFVWDYLLPVTSIAYCYGSIVSEVRRRTTAVSPTPPIGCNSESEDQRTHLSARILLLCKTNGVKARVAHMVLFGLCWCPCHICLLILSWSVQDIKLDETYTAGLCLGCLQVSLFGTFVNAILDGRLMERIQAIVTRCRRHTGSSLPQNGDNG